MGYTVRKKGPKFIKYPKFKFWFLSLFGDKEWVKEKKEEIDCINKIRIKEFEKKPARQVKYTLNDFDKYSNVIIDLEDEYDHVHLKTYFGRNYIFSKTDILKTGIHDIVRNIVEEEKRKEREKN